jgi:Fic family protein
MLKPTIDRLRPTELPIGTAWLLADCMEARGKQDLWTRQKPAVLDMLREQAIIQSAESSNRIEGVTVPRERLRPVVLGHAKPQDRSEEELAGYRKALDWVFGHKAPIPISPKTIVHLHALAQGGSSGEAGKWKERDNEIIEFSGAGERRVRFKPTPAKDVPLAVERLCGRYQAEMDDLVTPPLLMAGAFVFDFLCIHPFRDGNGRVSRLLTTLLLQQQGFVVGRFVSLERLVEESTARYYEVLEECSRHWHEGRNDIVPWWNYLLTILRRGYQEFERRIESAQAPAKADLVRVAIMNREGFFTLMDITSQCPAVSPQMVKKMLAVLKRENIVQLTGRGRGARWRRIE